MKLIPPNFRRVSLDLSFPDSHILRAYLSQNNHEGSWQRRMIRDLDASIEEANRDRHARKAA